MAKRAVSTKEYVDFYRFWSWEYVKRNPNFQRILGIIQSDFEDEETISREIRDLDLENDRCKDGIRLSDRELLDRFLMNYYGFNSRTYDTYMLQQEYTSDEILIMLQNGEEFDFYVHPRGGNKSIRVLESGQINNGEKSVSYKDFVLDGYDFICAINFRAPLDLLYKQINQYKSVFDSLYGDQLSHGEEELIDLALEVERKFIEQRPGVAFDTSSWISRTIGLWLWDYIMSNFGPELERGAISKSVRALREYFDMEKLGKGITGMVTFQNYFRWTDSCIVKAEVFPFKAHKK